MKKLITILISFIGCITLLQGQQQKAPMVVSGKMHISGPVWSEGHVHIYAYDGVNALDTGKIDIENIAGAVLRTDTIIFYSNNKSDGLLRNMKTADAGVLQLSSPTNAPTAVLRKKFDNMQYTFFSLPFRASGDLKKSSDRNIFEAYDLFIFDAEKRALTSSTAAVNNWKRDDLSPNNEFDKAKGYQIRTLGAQELDFMAIYQTDMDTLFHNHSGHDKPVNITLHKAEMDKWEWKAGDGWAFIGGIHTSYYKIHSSTVPGYTGIVYYRRSDSSTEDATRGYDQISLDHGESVILPPYTPFFIQDTSTFAQDNIAYKTFTHKGGTGSLEITNPVYHYRSTNTGSVKDQLALFLTSDKDSFDDRFYIDFADNYVDTYRGREDGLKMSTVYKSTPAVWSIGKDTAKLFVNGLPIRDELEVKMGFSVPESGDYTISLNPLRQQDVRNVILLDKATGKKTDLLQTPYSFNLAGVVENENNRFVLYINSSYTDIPSINPSNPYAYVKDNLLTVKNLLEGDLIQVLDLAGRTVVSGKVSGKEFSTALSQKGVYLVNVKGKKASVLKVLNK